MTPTSTTNVGVATQQIRDKIAQAYLGLWGDPVTQDRARRRLHWLAKHCLGDKVLDIGCSEGMLAILLAREGFTVTGVDVNPDEIEYARDLMKTERDFVQSRIEFVLADVLAADLKEQSYNTVVLGEVIEHLVRPELMIDRALKYTKPGGRLLLTTPFGYFPDIDHRQSFVMTQLVEILSSRCKPLELSIKDGYIRFAGLNEPPQKQDWRKYDLSHLLGLTEKAVVEAQRNLHERINGLKDRQKNIQLQLDQNKQTIETSKKNGTELTQKVQALEKAVVVREGEIGRIKKQLTDLQKEQEGTLNQTAHLKQQMEQAGSREKLLQDQVNQIDSEKEQLQMKNMQLHEDAERLREKIEELHKRDDQHKEDFQAKIKDMEQMQSWSNGLQEDLKRLNQQTESQNREISLLREQLEQTRGENQRAWDELGKRNLEVGRLGELADNAQTKSIQLEMTLQERDKQLADAQESIRALTEQATQYKNACKKTSLEVDQYREHLEETTRNLAEKTDQVNQLKTENSELASSLDEAEAFMEEQLIAIRQDLTAALERSERLETEKNALADQADQLNLEKSQLAEELEKAEVNRHRNEEINRLHAQLEETQDLARKMQRKFEALNLEQAGNGKTSSKQLAELEKAKTSLNQFEEQKRELEQNLLGQQSEMGRLRQGHMRLQNSYDLLAKREYLSRIRSLEVEQTIAYKLGIAITQAMAHPGLRSLGRIFGELSQSLTLGRRKMKGTSDPVVMSLDIQMPDGSQQKLVFTSSQPEKLQVTGQQIQFTQSADESVRLIAKPTAKITEASGAMAIPLKPDQPYMLSGKFTLQGGRANLHVIEYSEQYCLQGRDYPIRTGDWQESWRTHIDHSGLCLAIELQGKGILIIEQFAVEKTSQKASTTQVMAVSNEKDGDKWTLLSPAPFWFQSKTPANALLVVKGRIRIHDEVDRKAGYALAKISYLDHSGKELPGPYKGTAYSKSLGWFSYLRLPETEAIASEILRLTPPPGAAQVKVGIRRWNARTPIDLFTKLEIAEQDRWAFPRFDKPTPHSEGKPVVASILDPFSEECFRYDLNLTVLSRDNWQQEIESAAPKMLLVESAWQGNSGQWSSVLTQYAKQEDNPLKLLLAYCRNHAIPTVFWNKEDPPNFEVFIDAARDFDVIFTTDKNCIPEYRKRCGHDRVYCLPFAAQPAIHNPIGKQELAEYDIAFAGTWYKLKHPERSELLPNVLDPASKYQLYIFDRMSDWLYDDAYQYPEQYKPFINHKISYEEMLYVHRAFKLILNTNSVINSPTMFSRRVFEILASSTPVVSTASKGVQEMFGDLVPVVVGPEQAKKQIDHLMDNPWYRKQLGHLGYRRVMQEHTVDKRVREIFNRAGLDGLTLREEFPKVTLAVATNRPDHLDKVKENFERQKYPNLELALVLNNDSFDKSAVERQFIGKDNVKVFQLPSAASLGECLNKAIDESTGSYWAKMDDDNIYLENYITDLMLPFRYSEADVVGKTSHFLYVERTGELMLRFPEHEHNYEDVVNGGTILAKRSVFERVRFAKTSVGEDSQFLSECLEQGLRVYAADCFNCVIIRKADTSSHTWEIEETDLLRNCRKICDGLRIDFVDPDLGISKDLRETKSTTSPKQPPTRSQHTKAVVKPTAQTDDFANALDEETAYGIMKTFGQESFDLKPFILGQNEEICLSNTDDIIQLFSSGDAFYIPIKGHWMYQLSGFGHCSKGKFEKAGLIQFLFLDKDNRIIDEHYPFSSFSKNYGNFKYLRVAPNGADNDFEVVTPINAATMIIGFRQFHPQQPSEVNPVWHLENRGKFVSPEDFALDYDRFFETTDQSKSDTMVFLFAGTKSIGLGHRGNRPMRFARLIADRGIPIIYNYYRWRSSSDIVTYDGGSLFQTPIDVTAMKMVDIATHPYPQKRKIFMLSMPNSDAVKYLGLFKEYGWTVIYECRDDWEEFWKVGVGKWYHPLLEHFVTAKSDGVTTVSCTLADKMARWRLPDTLAPRVIPNGLDPAFTNRRVRDYEEMRRQKTSGQTVIGYHGHLTGAWFDWDLVIETARKKPDWRFEIIGFDAPSDLDLPVNVVYMGPKSHEEIQAIALGWTVTIIPFKPSKLAEGVDPIKVYEYLAMALPVVSVYMPQILDYPCVRCYNDGTQFIGMIEEALQTPFETEHVEDWLKTRTWQDRIDETFAFVDELRQVKTTRTHQISETQSQKKDNGRASALAVEANSQKSVSPETSSKKVSRKQKKRQQRRKR